MTAYDNVGRAAGVYLASSFKEGDHATGVADPGYSDLSADATNDAGGTQRTVYISYCSTTTYCTD